uniref:ASCH domain-containing protein n=1 Tax=Magnetococcus massalia (strain MO-1) TaxID=451514 RepID=A0A1S7LI65_MAGMO|nr:conserved protein of unknown function [Candidatus Magnetococcus massalia]
MFVLKFNDDLLGDIKSGRKNATTRMGKRDIGLGRLGIVSTSGNMESLMEVDVTSVTFKRFMHITDADAKQENFASATDLKLLLKTFYPYIEGEDVVTCVNWQPLA